jgi:hypothetical protein
MEIASGWHTKSLLFLSALLAISMFIFRISATSTDVPANLLAFCAWVLFCKLMLVDEIDSSINEGWDFVLLLILIALAVTFKLSMLPAALFLPLLLLRASVRQITVLFVARSVLFITLFYCILWLARNLVLTGCIVYPVSVTCLSVPWGVGAATAKIDAAWITGWARHPGLDALEFLGVLNMKWIPAWFKGTADPYWQTNVRGSVELKLVVASVSFITLSYVFMEPRDQSSLIRNSPILVVASIVCAVTGLVLWFLAAPDLRFSWAFFAILSATLMFHGLCVFDFTLPKIGLKPLRLRKFLTWSVVLAATAAIIQLQSGSLVPVVAPTPPFKIVTVSGNWQIYMPTSGDQCWELFPCAGSLGLLKPVESWHDRLFFHSNIRQP